MTLLRARALLSSAPAVLESGAQGVQMNYSQQASAQRQSRSVVAGGWGPGERGSDCSRVQVSHDEEVLCRLHNFVNPWIIHF